MELNRRVLCLMSSLGVIPCEFEEDGRIISGNISKARFTFWKILLFISILYSLYINITLILSVLIASDSEGHQSLGIHINRALLSAAFSFWAYELFVVNREGLILLYNFAQTNAGEWI